MYVIRDIKYSLIILIHKCLSICIYIYMYCIYIYISMILMAVAQSAKYFARWKAELQNNHLQAVLS